MDADTQAARNFMVDSQVRPNKVTDPRVIAAMRRLPRESFVPPAQAALAYSDTFVPLGGNRYLLEPMAIARLIQAAAVRPGDKALVIASGSGYGAAVLAECGAVVTALEGDAALIAMARATLPASVTQVTGPLDAGWAAGAPFDIILIEGAVEHVPAAIASQLKPHGRLLAVRQLPGQLAGRLGQAVLGEPSTGGLSFTTLFDCAAPKLPLMQREAGFVF